MVDGELIYLKEVWLEDDTARTFLHCYSKFYKHFDNSATSRAEGAHWMPKKDLLDLQGMATFSTVGNITH